MISIHTHPIYVRKHLNTEYAPKYSPITYCRLMSLALFSSPYRLTNATQSHIPIIERKWTRKIFGEFLTKTESTRPVYHSRNIALILNFNQTNSGILLPGFKNVLITYSIHARESLLIHFSNTH